MAFPGNYNFSYYRGDTFEFNIYPKNSADENFLSDVTVAAANFVMSTDRGSVGFDNQVAAIANVEADYINCVITPETGLLLDASRTYVYDVEIVTSDGKIYTLVTGNISITDHVSGATAGTE